MSRSSSSPEQDAVPGLIAYPGEQILTAGTLKEPLHLAIGMFDGVHLGHQAVLRQAVQTSRTDPGSVAGVLTFDPHPSRVLRPGQATPLLMPLEQRIERMLSMGVDLVFVQPFTRAYASREAAEFLKSLQSSFPGLRSVHIGENFRFGARRSGDVDTLTETGGALGVDVGILERENHGGEPISSSAIRKALGAGDISGANAMLGSPYTIRGTIVPGKKVGRGLGFPTVNIPWDPEARPQFGVYAVTARELSSGNILRGIANYGLRPTVDDADSPLLEVHFLEGQPMPTTSDLVEVSLLAFIRPERKFPSKEELRVQIGRDVEEIAKRGLLNGADSPENS